MSSSITMSDCLNVFLFRARAATVSSTPENTVILVVVYCRNSRTGEI